MEKEAKKWRTLAFVITGAGILVIALLGEMGYSQWLLAAPIYFMFVYVYYKYICLRKAAAQEKEEYQERMKQQVDAKVVVKGKKNKKKKDIATDLAE